MKLRYIAASVLLHASLLITTAPQQQESLARPSRSPITHVTIVDGGGSLGCSRYYVGVGVMLGVGDKIEVIAANSPAARAGLQLGDIFKPLNEPRGELGGTVTIDIERGDEKFRVTVKRDRICESN